MNKWEELRWWSNGHHQDMWRKLHKTPHQPNIGDLIETAENPFDDTTHAFRLTPFDKIKVVILGQDPYPTAGMATGLAFSVPKEVKTLPPTLSNIFREYESDLHYPRPKTGDLTPWTNQGVLLWNCCLTVAPGKPGSHRDLGWEELTYEVLTSLEREHTGLVFILWGKDAQNYLPLILPSRETGKHNILLSSHPSPLSARRGFFGSRPFSTANAILTKRGIPVVDWRLP